MGQKMARSIVAGNAVLLAIVLLALVSATRGYAQTNPTGSLVGTVLDASGAVITGATIHLTETTTGTAFDTQSGNDGHFSLGNLPPGTYSATVSRQGFQTGAYERVQIVVGQVYDLKVTLKVGAPTTTVTVEAGAQVLQTTQTEIGTTISGPVITEIPSDSNTALWGATMMSPAIQTIGGPRQSSAEGLPGGAVNVTFDGIAAQWQPGKSGDPLFTMIYTTIDDVAEVNVSTAASSSNNTGEGAVQVNLVSQRGTNQFHGGAWEYFRNDALNSNYYFNNLAGSPRPKMRYNQYGFKLGGPILKNKLFFFGDVVWLDRPESSTQTRTILNAQAATGKYTYAVTSIPASTPAWVTCDNGSLTCTADLMQMAGNFGGTSQIDSVIGQGIAASQQALAAPGVHSLGASSLYQQQLTFNSPGTYSQQMPDFRLDWNVSQNHSLEFDYHLTRFVLGTDILNGQGITYPVSPFDQNQGGYTANRTIWAWAWRWNLGATKSNELRFGFQASPESFAGNINPAVYPIVATNLGSIHVQPVFPTGSSGDVFMTNPWLTTSPNTDNPGVGQLSDNFVWAKGNHNMAFGFTLTRALYHDSNSSPAYAQVPLGLDPNDPMAANFNNATLPGAGATDLGNAGQLYGLLAGHVMGYTGSVALDPSKRQFVTGRNLTDKYHQTDLGIYASDSWRFRPNLTFNYGLRWQYEGVPVDDLNEYFNLQGGAAAVYGVSGAGNLFKPGTMAGAAPVYVLNSGKPWYNNWYKGFAPSVGVAWQPELDTTWWHKIFGEAGDSVFRGGYSIAYSREGTFNWAGPNNPGLTGAQFTTAVDPSGTIGAGEFGAGSLLLQDLSIQTLDQNPSSFQTTNAINPAANNAVWASDPNLHMPYIQSWSLGIQRQITPDMAFEVRYVGNHGVGLLETVNLNEVNIFENGFLNEFNNAATNLQICNATPSCASSPSFADLGLSGQAPLPIFTAAFTGSSTGSQSDPNFSSGTFLTPLQTGQAGAAATTLSGLSFWRSLVSAGYPSNFWIVNPDATGGAYLTRNGFQSTYNALVLDLRRRPSHGLEFDFNYAWSHGLTDDWQRNTNNATDAFTSLRLPTNSMKGPSPYDLRSVIKAYAVYELPFGAGHRLSSENGIVNRLISGWVFNAVNRWQTGRSAILFGGFDTFNQNDGGVVIPGGLGALQSSLSVYKTATPAPGAVWYFPQSALGAGGNFTNPQVLASCGTPGKFCQRAFIYGPQFFRADWSLQKNTKITERVGTELRFEFLNAFNNANFLWGDAYNASGFSAGASFFSTVSGNLTNPTFGRIFTAYQDPDSSDDLGGRIIQIVARIKF